MFVITTYLQATHWDEDFLTGLNEQEEWERRYMPEQCPAKMNCECELFEKTIKGGMMGWPHSWIGLHPFLWFNTAGKVSKH